MNNRSAYVDPFWGNGESRIKQTQGPASTWFFLKAQTGNTHPGPCLPFGCVCTIPYSGGYPTGYGSYAPASYGKPPRYTKHKTVIGFSHFAHSGTGAIGKYYNYFLTKPSQADHLNFRTSYRLESEKASPGYYEARFGPYSAQASVTHMASAERYTFSHEKQRIIVNMSMGGLAFEDRKSIPSKMELCVIDGLGAQGTVWMEGIPIHVYAVCDEQPKRVFIVKNDQCYDERYVPNHIGMKDDIGFAFDFSSSSNQKTIFMGYSFIDTKKAQEHAYQARQKGFEKIVHDAQQQWDEALGTIDVATDEENKKRFYSAFYHSIVKPCRAAEENPFTKKAQDGFFDFATMWDIYKTQLPLVLTLYPDFGRAMVDALINISMDFGGFPNAILLIANNGGIEEKQARCLAFYTILDAFYRGLDANYEMALESMRAEFAKDRHRDFFERGMIPSYPTHTMDLAGAANCAAILARSLGHRKMEREMNKVASYWENAFDANTGLLREGTYYEGGLWNYSFRLLHDMDRRIALSGGKKRYVEVLDRFFGYGRPGITQPTNPKDHAYMQYGAELQVFEGFNNEPDMETPYNYIYADRHDRTCEVVRAGLNYHFTNGEGALPGNNDSGGLSSCMMWNAMGLFPVTGQPIFLLGSPLYEQTVITPKGGLPFCIKAKNDPIRCFHINDIYLNGTRLNRRYITVQEFLQGGQLVFENHDGG